ncbi:MAG: cation transporter [Telluria sp.]
MALILNAAMFIVGAIAGVAAQSTGVLADALDMLTDAAGYTLALRPVSRGPAFKRRAARWTGGVLLMLGAGIVADVMHRWLAGSEPVGTVMMAYSVVALVVNVTVLTRLTRYRHGEVHLKASYICTRADVLANLGVFASGAIVAPIGMRVVDLVAGFAIGVYVLKEAREILRDAAEAGGEHG